jgi:hypothetical protein
MTVESRNFIGLDEIVAIEITCNNPTCRARATIPIGTGPLIYERCPQCDAQWVGPDREAANARSAFDQFLRSLMDVIRLSGALKCKLQLEISAPIHKDSQ